MSTYAGPFSGKDRRALTRADVEERIRQAGDSSLVDFTREDLSNADLNKMRLFGTLFLGADLRGANLREADLREADLREADLSEADLSEADLRGADLSEANLRGAKLSGAKLSGADLSEANLRGAKLSGVDLSEAKLSGAELGSAQFGGVDLSGVDLSGADLSGADLSGADLSEANLSEADLSGTNLSGANLREADLSEADLSGAILFGVNLTRADLSEAKLDETNKIYAVGPSIQLSNILATKPALHVSIVEDPLTLQHLADTLDTLIRLYVKLWLLDQQRFDDFVRYSTERDRSLEAEVPLPIVEMTYNSPWKGKINLDLSPKGVVEALQALIEMVAYFRLRKDAIKADLLSDQLDNQLKQEKLKQERLATIEHAFGTLEQGSALVDKLSPGLSEEQKAFALQSLAKEVLHLVSDTSLEIALIPSPSEKQKTAEIAPSPSAKTIETPSSASAVSTDKKNT
jgi:uncharacterized protein YjbI with pentapeptide repeats